jgi:hypothetical protein
VQDLALPALRPGGGEGSNVAAHGGGDPVHRASELRLGLEDRDRDDFSRSRSDERIRDEAGLTLELVGYFHARLPEQFDAVVHTDETRAVVPLERTAGWEAGELPETYPWAV